MQELELGFQWDGKLPDLINSSYDCVDIKGWYSEKRYVTIKNFQFINFRKPIQPKSMLGWVHLDSLRFINCTFKDINFIGAVPIDRSNFKGCTFENCLFSDHLRWTKFDNCSFKFCLFGGYFHGVTFRSNCTFTDILIKFYSDDCYFFGKCLSTAPDNIFEHLEVSKEKEEEILNYFYNKEINELKEKFPIGGDHYYDKNLHSIDKKPEFWVKDKIKDYFFDFTHSVLERRIVGEFYKCYIPFKESLSEAEFLKLKR